MKLQAKTVYKYHWCGLYGYGVPNKHCKTCQWSSYRIRTEYEER